MKTTNAYRKENVNQDSIESLADSPDTVKPLD